MRKSSYLLKLVIFTLMVGTFPVLTLGWYSYHHSSQSALKQVEEGNSEVLRLNQLRVEQTLKLIDYSTSQILGLPAVANAIPVRLGIGDRERVLELYNILASIQTYELGIKDVYLFSLEKDWIITNAGMDDYNDPKLKERLRSFSSIPQGSVWVNYNSVVSPSGESSARLEHAVLSIKKWPINTMNPRGLIGVVVSSQQLNQLIDSTPQSGGIFILDANNRVIADSTNARVGSDLSNIPYVNQIRQQTAASGVLIDEADGEKTSVSFRKSSYNGWTYMLIVPTRTITRQAMTIGWTSILVSIGVLIATLIAAFIGSRRMYSPVRRIYRVLLDGKEEVKKDELAAISDRIEGILSDQTRLKFEIEGQKTQFIELLARKWMLGETNGKEIRDRLQYYGYRQIDSWEIMRVMLCQIDRLDSKRFTEKDRDLLLFAVSNIVSEIMPIGENLPPIVIQESVVFVVGARAQSEKACKEAVFELSSQIQASVKRYLQLETSIGISRSFKEWTEASRGYEEGRNALKYRTRLGEEAILFIEDVQPDKSKEVIYPKELGEELLGAFNALDAERARSALSSVVEALASQDYDHNDFQMALVRLLMDLVRLLQDAGVSYQRLKNGESSLFEEFLKLHTASEMQGWLNDNIISPGILLLEARRQAQFTSISQAVKRIIEEAFDTDLTLEKCSARINYHPQYISRVFRQETGINFAEYLAQYRLEIAKRWLEETDLKITEIAEKLKYNNPANFIRYFRKIEGMTPGQYRDLNWRV